MAAKIYKLGSLCLATIAISEYMLMFAGTVSSFITRGSRTLPHLSPVNGSRLLFSFFLFFFFLLLFGICDVPPSLCWEWCFVRSVSHDSFSLDSGASVRHLLHRLLKSEHFCRSVLTFSLALCLLHNYSSSHNVKKDTAVLCFRKVEKVGTYFLTEGGKVLK